MATRVTLPPLEPDHTTAFAATELSVGIAAPVPVAKVQLLNDRGDRRAEAEWLTAAARPGIVELISTSDEPFTIVTAHAGARTMRTARLDPEAGLALLTQVTELLAQLHRDGFVHGKLSVDHVIVGLDGPVLCSPDGTITTPEVDLDGIARCMRELNRQWDETNATCPWRTQWDDLAKRLEDATDPSRSAIRTTQALRRLAQAPSPSAPKPDRRAPKASKGLGAAIAAVMVAVVGIAFVPNNQEATVAGPRFTVEGSTYAVGQVGDDVAHLRTPCDPHAPVVSLRPGTGEIWAFRSINDGATSEPIAVVPGATEIRSEQRSRGDHSCHIAVARGPAGASEIDTSALMATTEPAGDR